MEIPDFYRGRSVLVTGATGFIGKAIVEKLLRCCPDVERIYLLVRPKYGVDPQQRLNHLLALPLFAGCPISKVTAVAGDVSLPGLGLSVRDHDLVVASVSVLLHSAATVSFQEALHTAVQVNVQGSQNVVQLARTITNLAALVHISTAYSNCDRLEVREEVYPPPADVQDMIRRSAEDDEKALDRVTPGLLGGRPNTYTFTKALAENYLAQEAVDLPVAIVRPSIVAWSWRDPWPGFVDHVKGVIGPFAAVGHGTMRSVHGEPSFVADIVPVDFVVNTVLAVAWHTARDRPMLPHDPADDASTRDGGRTAPRASAAVPTVYNCVTGSRNPATWGQLLEYWLRAVRVSPSRDALWWPGSTFTPSRWQHNLRVAALMLLPAFLFDLIAAALTGKRTNMFHAQLKAKKMMQLLLFFLTHEWTFADGNTRRLGSLLSPRDRLLFPVDVAVVDWEAYMRAAAAGLYRHLEGDGARSRTRSRTRPLYLVHKATQLAFLALLAALVALLGWMLRPLALKVWPSSTLNFIRFYLSKR